MSLDSFTRKFEDKSTERGFQFIFYCDISDDGFETQFTESSAGKKAGRVGLLGKGVDLGASVLSHLPVANPAATAEIGEKSENLAEDVSKRLGEDSPEWHREHDLAFENAQQEAREHFNQCPACARWVCPYCWDREKGLCVEDKARTTICPHCHEPAGHGKFCNRCGSPLFIVCPKCHAESPAGTPFCGECGMPLEGSGPPT